MLSVFPNLTTKEFEQACSDLRQRYHRHGNDQRDWQSVEIIQHFDETSLKITKDFRSDYGAAQLESEQHDLEEDDDEVLQVIPDIHPVVHYDVLLSPVYRVPVLYFSISDPQHRFPPTMSTLYEHLIAPSFKVQTESGGVIGGVTINVSISIILHK
jgi:ubiquitin-like-conjugating enzyme ATG10